MRKKQILFPPEGVEGIHAFGYEKNQIILLYSTSSREESWINIYKNNHTCTNDIIPWCQGHGIAYQLLGKRLSNAFRRFMCEKMSEEMPEES